MRELLWYLVKFTRQFLSVHIQTTIPHYHYLCNTTKQNKYKYLISLSTVMQSAATGGGAYPAVPGSGAVTTTTSTTGSRARDLGLRAQKKLLGRFAASNAGRSLLIDDATTSLLDNLYRLMERGARSSQQLDKKQPEKVLKNIVKLSIKVRMGEFWGEY